jgi:DNA-binding LacI/PurR family transcriptional regulator
MATVLIRGMIALALPSIRGAYFSELAHLVVQEAERHSLTVLIDCTAGDLQRERMVAEGFPEPPPRRHHPLFVETRCGGSSQA